MIFLIFDNSVAPTSQCEDVECLGAGHITCGSGARRCIKFFESCRKATSNFSRLISNRPRPLRRDPARAGRKPRSSFFLKGLILAQNERWRRGLGMQVERIPEGLLSGGSGERGSKAWVTYPGDRDSRPNGRVIPGDVSAAPAALTKGVSAAGGAHVVLAGWWGNGPPRQRCLAGVRARPAPLALRHWPDSYGRLQSRIFGNGRKPDRATPRVR